MRKHIRHVTIHPLFFLCLAWIVFTDSTFHLLAILASILLHELGHLLIYIYAGVVIEEIRFQPFAVGIVPQKQACISRKTQACCAITGPLINLTCAGACYILSNYIDMPQWLTVFYASSLFLGIFNLLPILPLDGSRLLDIILSAVWNEYVAGWICHVVSLILGTGMLIFGIYMLVTNKLNLSICMLSCYILISLSVKLYYFLKKRKSNAKSKS